MGAIALSCAAVFANRSAAENPRGANPPAAAPAPPAAAPTPDDVLRWIKDLGHDAFAVRQAAASHLLSAGMVARRPLLELADGPDPETRAAARRLVALIDRTEFRRRLEAFAADTEDRQNLTLPGWDQFRKLVGGDPAARTLFVDMQQQEGVLIAAVFGVSKRPPEELWETRLLRIAQWQATAGDRSAIPSLGSCAAMLFLGSLAEMNVSDSAAAQLGIIIQRPPVRELLAPDSAQVAVRKLVVTWLLQCPNKNEEVLSQRLNIIASIGLADALPLALQVSAGDPQYLHVQPLTKAVAILAVGKIGRREHVDRLEPLLEDSTVCLQAQVQTPGQPPAVVQVRDVALSVMLLLTDQAAADYGYTNARMATPRTFHLQSLYRENDRQRDEAIAKWREWRATHK